MKSYREIKKDILESDSRERRMADHRRVMEALEFQHAAARVERLFPDPRRFSPAVRRAVASCGSQTSTEGEGCNA